MISIIVAIAENYAIGKDNDLLWHIPGDLKRFRKLTTGHTIVMGKRTYLSLPKRPLPDRRNLVISDDPLDCFENCLMASSIEDALSKLDPSEENFIIGGASVYSQFLPFTDRLYITWVRRSFDGDVFFPQIDFAEWNELSREDILPEGYDDLPVSYCIYEKSGKK